MDIILFHSIWTVVMLVLFVGIWAWAWSSKRKADFEVAARMPLDDDGHGRTNAAIGRMPGAADNEGAAPTRTGEHNNG